MKKIRIKGIIILALVGILLLGACSSDTSAKPKISDEKILKIGISQLAEHPALDGAREGFVDGLEELGLNVEIDYQNAQGDIPTALSISQKFVRDDVDLIYAIATSAAQSAKQSTSDIPILFSAVTDPVAAELIDTMEKPGGNITGTSDESPIRKQLQIFKDLDENIKKIGVIFNTNEENSHTQVKMAKEIAKELDLEIVDKGITSISDIPQTVDSIVKNIDGIYTITDNMVASGINIVSEKALENNIITVGAEDSHVKGGILISDGISYYELGKQTAEMAKEILVNEKSPSDIPSSTLTNTKKFFNLKTLEKLGVNKENKVFKDATEIEE